MIRRLIVVLFLLPRIAVAEPEAQGVKSTICEAEANVTNSKLSREARVYLGLVRLGVREGDIQRENLAWLETQNQIANPLNEKRKLRTTSLSQGIERVRLQVASNEWDSVKAELRNLTNEVHKRTVKADEARDETSPVFALRPLIFNSPVARGPEFKSFTSRKNEFFYFSIQPGSSFIAKLNSDRAYEIEDPPPNSEMVDFFEGRDGQVYCAWVSRSKIRILNLHLQKIIFEKNVADSTTLDAVTSTGVTVAPIIFEAPEGIRIALVAPPGNSDGERKKALVIFDLKENNLRSEFLPLGKSNVSRLEDGRLYAYGVGSMREFGDKVKLYISEVGQSLSGIESWVEKEPLRSANGLEPRMYLRDGQPQMMLIPRSVASPMMYNQMTGRLSKMPGMDKAFFTKFAFFTSSQGKASFFGLELDAESEQPTALKVGEVGNLKSVKTYTVDRSMQQSVWGKLQRVDGPTGPLLMFWEGWASQMRSLNIVEDNTGEVIHMRIPERWRISDASPAFYDPTSRRVMTWIYDRSVDEWRLFQIYGPAL